MLNNYMAIRQLKKQLKKDRRELDDLKWELHKQTDGNDRESTLFVISIVQERIVETRNELEELVGQTSVYSFSLRKFYTPYNRKGVFIMMNNFMEIGKRIIVVGTKAVTLAAGGVVVSTFANAGVEAIKGITLDNLLKKQEEIKMESMGKLAKAVKYAQTGVRVIGAAALVIVATKATKEGI